MHRGKASPESIGAAFARILEAERALTALLGAHPDYSVCASIRLLEREHPVNPYFIERTIKENVDNVYCRGFVYETMAALTIPELAAVRDWLLRCAAAGSPPVQDDALKARIREIHDGFLKTDIFAYEPEQTDRFIECCADFCKAL